MSRVTTRALYQHCFPWEKTIKYFNDMKHVALFYKYNVCYECTILFVKLDSYNRYMYGDQFETFQVEG